MTGQILPQFGTYSQVTKPNLTNASNEDDLQQKMTFNRRWPSTEDDLRKWKMEYLSLLTCVPWLVGVLSRCVGWSESEWWGRGGGVLGRAVSKPSIAKPRAKILEIKSNRLQWKQLFLDSRKAKKADQYQTKNCQPSSQKKIPNPNQLLPNPNHKQIHNTIWTYIVPLTSLMTARFNGQ